MKQYLDLIKDILENGNERADRTNTGTIAIFGRQLRFNLEHGFPLVTTKKVYLRSIIEELLWFIAGDTSNTTLVNKNVSIWNEWAVKEDSDTAKKGDLGPIYGKQWRNWSHEGSVETTELTLKQRLDLIGFSNLPKHTNSLTFELSQSKKLHLKSVLATLNQTVSESESYLHALLTSWGIPGGDKSKVVHDQLSDLITKLQTHPYSRRHVISTWNVPYLPDEAINPQANVLAGKMALAPCHTLFQFYVEDIPFNKIQSYISDKVMQLAFISQCSLVWSKCDSGKEITEDTSGNNFNVYPTGFIKDMTQWCNENGVRTKRLSCQLYARSQDSMLGTPYNIASYSLLIMMIAQVTNMVAGDYIHTSGDTHIYKNHIIAAKEQITRIPHPLPKVTINPEVKDIFSFKLSDFTLDGYTSHPTIDYAIAI